MADKILMEKLSTSVLPEVAERIRRMAYGPDGNSTTPSASSVIAMLIDEAFAARDGKSAADKAAANEAADLIRTTAQSVDMVLDRLTDGNGKSEIANVREAAGEIEAAAKHIRDRMVEPRIMLAAVCVAGVLSGLVGAVLGAVL